MISGGLATVYVTDMTRAVDFYVNKLGLKLQYQAGNDWAQIDAGKGLILGLHPTHPGGPAAGQSGSQQVGFELDEPLATVYAALAERGVPFDGPIMDTGHIRLAYFHDPDRNTFYLSETPKG